MSASKENENERDRDHGESNTAVHDGISEKFRKAFRYPGKSELGIQIMINEKGYDLADIGSNGAGVLINENNELGDVGDSIKATLHCGDKRVKIDCRIVHVSAEEKNKFRCGLEFNKLDADTESRLFECMNLNRKNYFDGF